MLYSKEKIEKALASKNYKWFDGGDYDLNIVGVRNSATGQEVTNKFDDIITCSFRIGEEWIYKEWPMTADSGKAAVLNFTNAAGVARLVEGQYRGSHMIGLHRGKYTALRQKKPMSVYRDNNKDLVYDEDVIQTGIFGINIHRSNAKTESTIVDHWSHGCQVFKRADDFDDFMAICETAKNIWGNSFTYTLIKSSDMAEKKPEIVFEKPKDPKPFSEKGWFKRH